MNRELTTREKFLLLVLAIMLLVSLYYLLVYQPVEEQLADLALLEAETEDAILMETVRLAQLNKMEEELEQIFAAADGNPTEIAAYDNAKQVMNELNAILTPADNYSLNFTVVAPEEDNIVRRQAALSFTCSGYQQARDMLTALHDSPYRSLISDLNLQLSYEEEGVGVSGSAQIVYFEYLR